MNGYITVRGERLPLTRLGRLLLDTLTVVGVVLMLWVTVAALALCE